tara:strand:- start:843 stop:1748 length:906 start_codon:yes stop_codon:yes gene_type:complete
MRIIGTPRPKTRAKTFNEGVGNLFKPGAGETGIFGFAGQALGAKATYDQMTKMPMLQAEALQSDVDSKQRLLERAAIMPEMSRMGLDETQSRLEDSQRDDAADLATLLESGMNPQQADKIMSERREGRTSALLQQLGRMDALQNQSNLMQKQATDQAAKELEASKVLAEQQDILGQEQANIDALYTFGTQATELEGLINPQAGLDKDTKKTRGAKISERGYKHGGITPGPHDHDVLNLIISHEDGSPALDADGDEMHVTGSEAIIPDYIFEELMAAAKAGDKNALFEIFMDEIATEERFQV